MLKLSVGLILAAILAVAGLLTYKAGYRNGQSSKIKEIATSMALADIKDYSKPKYYVLGEAQDVGRAAIIEFERRFKTTPILAHPGPSNFGIYTEYAINYNAVINEWFVRQYGTTLSIAFESTIKENTKSAQQGDAPEPATDAHPASPPPSAPAR